MSESILKFKDSDKSKPSITLDAFDACLIYKLKVS